MDRRHFITTALGAALAGATLRETVRAQSASPPVSIALLPGFCPKLYVARDLGLIEQAGIAPKYLKFLAGPPMLSALRNGDIDIAFMSANPLITGISQGLDLQCFFIDSDELHAEGLVVRPGSGITKLSEIRGKKIGTTRGTAGYYGLKKAMATVGLTDKDVQLLDMNLPTFIPAFTGGDVDGLFVWSPWLHKLEQMGGKIVATMASVGITLPQNLYVGRGDWLARNPESARRFVGAMEAATAAIRKDPDVGLKSVTNALEIPRDLGEKVFANETLITLQQMSDPAYPASLVVPNGGMHNGLKEQAEFLTNEGFLKQMPDLSRAVQPGPIQAYLKTR